MKPALSLLLGLFLAVLLPAQRYEKVNLRPSPDASPASVASLLAEHRLQGYPAGTTLRLRHAKESPGGQHYEFALHYQGHDVIDATLLATLDHSGRVIALVNNLLPFQSAGQAPAMDVQQLSAWVQARFGNDPQAQGPFWQQSQPGWRVEEDQLIATYAVEYSQGITVLRSLIDAQTLAILSTRDLGVYHRAHTALGPDSATCVGYVFHPDPVSPVAAPYAGNYQDDNDADNSVLTAARVQVPLLGLAFSGGLYRLDGPYVRIAELENPNVTPVTSATGTFDYTRNQSGFEDVMVYYHIDNFQRYLQSLGFTNLCDTALNADSHGLSGQDNSHFIPAGTNSRIAFGEGGVDDAEDADVIVHEYGHALSYSALPGGNSGTERLGLDEGIGDYIAASYSKAISYNFWKNTFSWDGHNEFWPGRSASTSATYPPGTSNIYAYGELWATALMEAQQQVGRTVCDRVFFQSLYSNASNISLVDAAYIILDADSLLYGGAHTQAFKTAFCARNIFSGTGPGQACAVGKADPATELAFQVFPNPTQGQVQVQLKEPATDAVLTLRDTYGRTLLQARPRGLDAQLDLSGLPAGVYLLELQAKGKASTVQRVEVFPR
jgi:Secretion system C-terminal sorting domain